MTVFIKNSFYYVSALIVFTKETESNDFLLPAMAHTDAIIAIPTNEDSSIPQIVT